MSGTITTVTKDLSQGIDLMEQPATVRELDALEQKLVAKIPPPARPDVRYGLIIAGFVIAGILYFSGHVPEAIAAPGIFAGLAHFVK